MSNSLETTFPSFNDTRTKIINDSIRANYSAAQVHRQRSDAIAPVDSGALRRSSQTSAATLTGPNSLVVEVSNTWGDADVKYAKKRYYENNKNPHTKEYSKKGYINNKNEIDNIYRAELGGN